MIGFGFTAQTHFDRRPVRVAVDRGVRRAQFRNAAYVQRIAKNSIKPPRRVSLSEMTTEQRESHNRKLRDARRKGKRRPQRPFAPARPGEPPRDQTKALKGGIRFAYDATPAHMFIGVTAGKQRTARQLEHGGFANVRTGDGETVAMHFRGNPFMRPALAEATPRLIDPFRNCVTP